jgi:hypothetical protein
MSFTRKNLREGVLMKKLPTLTIINSVGERVPVGVEIADTDAERHQGSWDGPL